MKNIFKILIISLTTYSLNAMNCSNYKDFQFYNGHYYSTSIDKLDFESAKQIAINNGGTLAIPNNSSENDFIKNLIGGGSIGWIGIYDPNKIQNFCYGGACAYDDTRFKTIKNASLSYKNFHPLQPDNLIKQYDVVDGKAMVSPLGEHWVAMNGNNGKWYDMGHHADEYNNPIKYKAVFEFENLNECTPPTDDGGQELTGRFCNSKVWDETVDVVTMGQTFDCKMDSFGNEYCPEALAKAGEYWDYDDGFSVAGVGEVVDYTDKIKKYEKVCDNSVKMYSDCAFRDTLIKAKNYCDNLVEGGYSDWRLPTIYETKANHNSGLISCDDWTWTPSPDSSGNRVWRWKGLSVKKTGTTTYVRCVR